MSTDEWVEIIQTKPLSAKSWNEIFHEHPEFFRISSEGLISLTLRRTFQHDKNSRKPISESTFETLVNTALQFHTKEHERIRDSRWWIPVFAALMSFIGAILGVYLKQVFQ